MHLLIMHPRCILGHDDSMPVYTSLCKDCSIAKLA